MGAQKELRLKKPAKTREELEAAIRLEMEDMSRMDYGSFDLRGATRGLMESSIMTDGPQDTDRCDMIETIADRLRGQFDLKS